MNPGRLVTFTALFLLFVCSGCRNRPKLLLLDEPTSEVDPNTRREFWGQLFEMGGRGDYRSGETHSMVGADRCHHLAIIDKGAKVADGSPAQLKKDLGASIVEVTGGSLAELKGPLQATPLILATTQIGITLRVMIADSIEQPEKWLAEMFSTVERYTTRVTEPSIEDVFVRVTSNTEGRSMTQSLMRMAAVCRKEFLQLSRVRLTFGMVILVPLLQLVLFGYTINSDVRHVPAAVADDLNTQFSRKLILDIQATQVLDFVETAEAAEELQK